MIIFIIPIWRVNLLEKKILCTIMILMIFSPIMVKADYQVSSGATYTYDIITSSIDITVDSNSASGDKYILAEHSFSSGTQVEINNVDASSYVNWTISSGIYSEYYLSGILGDVIGLAMLMIRPTLIIQSYSSLAWNIVEDAVEQGTGLLILPFWDTDYLEGFEELAEETAISELQTATGFQDSIIEGNYAESGGNMIFDWYIGGAMVYTSNTFIFDYDIDHQFKIVYNLASGVMQGLKMKSSADGTYSGKDISLEYEFQIEIENYNIGDFALGPGAGLPGFEWFIAFIALGFLAIPILVRKIRK